VHHRWQVAVGSMAVSRATRKIPAGGASATEEDTKFESYRARHCTILRDVPAGWHASGTSSPRQTPIIPSQGSMTPRNLCDKWRFDRLIPA